jgi:hypothetical protein
MEETRTTKQLLQVMLENVGFISIDECHGLCALVCKLIRDEQINNREWHLLYDFIDGNRPSMFSSFEAFRHSQLEDEGFYWDRGKAAPRIKWLKKHIKRLGKLGL